MSAPEEKLAVLTRIANALGKAGTAQNSRYRSEKPSGLYLGIREIQLSCGRGNSTIASG